MKVKGPAGRKCLQKGGNYNLPFLIHACYSLLKKSSESLFIAFQGRNDRIMMLLYGRALESPSAHIICHDCSATSLVLRTMGVSASFSDSAAAYDLITNVKLSISETSAEKLRCTNDEHPDEEKCTNEETMGSGMTSLETIRIRPSPDHCPLSIHVNLTPDSKAPVASGKPKPEFAAVHTPASKQRVRDSRKRKCVYDETIVIPNKYSRI